jgi:hypothetical protein
MVIRRGRGGRPGQSAFRNIRGLRPQLRSTGE